MSQVEVFSVASLYWIFLLNLRVQIIRNYKFGAHCGSDGREPRESKAPSRSMKHRPEIEKKVCSP